MALRLNPERPRYDVPGAKAAIERGETTFEVYCRYPCFPHTGTDGCPMCLVGAMLVVYDRRNQHSLLLHCPDCGGRLKGGNYEVGITNRERIKDRGFSSLRFEILQRDRCRCFICNRGPETLDMEIDHIIPFSKGGPTDVLNGITLCTECNGSKSDDYDSDYTLRALLHTHSAKCDTPNGHLRTSRILRAMYQSLKDWGAVS